MTFTPEQQYEYEKSLLIQKGEISSGLELVGVSKPVEFDDNPTNEGVKLLREELALDKVLELSLQNRTLTDISKDPELKELLNKATLAWKEKNAICLNEIKQKDLLKLDLLEKEAFKGWKKSQKTKRKKQTKVNFRGNEVVDTEEDNFGDPRYLDVVRSCVQERAKLLGLYEHKGDGGKVELTKIQINYHSPNEKGRIDKHEGSIDIPYETLHNEFDEV